MANNKGDLAYTLEELYGVTTKEYFEKSGQTIDDEISRMTSEVGILRENFEAVRAEFISLSFMSERSNELLPLLNMIRSKFENKEEKIKRYRKIKEIK